MWKPIEGPKIRESNVANPKQQKGSGPRVRNEANTPGLPEVLAESFENLSNIMTSACRSIDIASPNLEPALFDKEEIVSAIVELARKGRYPRIRLLIANDNPSNLERHRLVALTRRLTSAVSLRVLSSHPEWRQETIVIGDQRQVLLLMQGQREQKLLDSPLSVTRWVDVFDRLWQASEQSSELKNHY